MSDVPGIPAAWYPDPADGRRLRYWDGSGWTEQLRDAAVEPTPVYDNGGQSANYVPFTYSGASAERRPQASSATVSIWLYTLVPLLLLTHQYFAWDFTARDFVNPVIHGGIALATVVLAILLPLIDRTELSNRGFERTPPAILGILPPIHLIARTFAVGPGGAVVALAGLIVQAVVVVVLVGTYLPTSVPATPSSAPPSAEGMTAPFTAAQVAHLLTPEGMAEKILFDAEGGSLHYDSVACEALSSRELGAQTICHAMGQLADYDLQVQVLPDGTNVPFVIVAVTPVLE